MIEVTCNDRLGKKIRVKCNEDDTVGDLKKLIAAQTGTASDRIVLKKWYTTFKDHITLYVSRSKACNCTTPRFHLVLLARSTTIVMATIQSNTKQYTSWRDMCVLAEDAYATIPDDFYDDPVPQQAVVAAQPPPTWSRKVLDAWDGKAINYTARNATSVLHEILQSSGDPAPTYDIESCAGFRCTCSVFLLGEYISRTTSEYHMSKKNAKAYASALILQELRDRND